MWYTIVYAVEDEEAQKKGIVTIFYTVDVEAMEPLYFEVLSKVRHYLNDCLPYRNAAVHYCYNNPAVRPALNMLQIIAGKQNRLRFRTHYGECCNIVFFCSPISRCYEKMQLVELTIYGNHANRFQY